LPPSMFPAPSPVQDCPALSWRAVACLGGGDAVGELFEQLPLLYATMPQSELRPEV
jgi:hypothetical protein